MSCLLGFGDLIRLEVVLIFSVNLVMILVFREIEIFNSGFFIDVFGVFVLMGIDME